MPIVVDYSPVGAIGAGAALGGQGWLKRWQDEFLQREIMQQNQILAQQAAQQNALAHAAEQAENQRRFQAERDQFQAGLQGAKDEADYQRKLTLGEHNFNQRKDLADLEYDHRSDLYDQQLDNNKALEDHRWTAKQKYELEKLNNEYQAIMDAYPYKEEEGWIPDGEDPEYVRQREEALRQWRLKRANIKPLPNYDLEANKKRVNYNTEQGVIEIQQPDGSLDVRPLPKRDVEKQKGVSPSELARLYDMAEKVLTEEKMDADNVPTKIRPSQEQKDAWVNDILRKSFQLNGRQGMLPPLQSAQQRYASRAELSGANPTNQSGQTMDYRVDRDGPIEEFDPQAAVQQLAETERASVNAPEQVELLKRAVQEAPIIQSKQDYLSLPLGAFYRDPQGNIRQKRK